MVIPLDRSLQKRQHDNSPIRVALVGAGVTGRMIAMQLLTPVAGIRVVAIANRTVHKAALAYRGAGVDDITRVASLGELEEAIAHGRYAITDDAMLVCAASTIDAIIEVTGTVEFGARVALKAMENRKHLILVNAELDSTIGPILKVYADRAGVVLTNTDGDEPGVAMTLLRYLMGVGLRPVAAGNLKGLIDRYRTPETQRDFAARYGQDPAKVTSFADGTKLSMEAAILANATGFRVGKRGMYGPRCGHVKDMARLLPEDQLLNGGLVDYALGAEPHTGAFVVAHEADPLKRQHMNYYKLGEGPFYVFYTPYHLPHIQIASTVGRAALFRDATVAPLGSPVCEVLTVAKRDLRAGETLDGVGGFCAYGVIENADVCRAEKLLPMGLAEGCRLGRDVRKDEPISFEHVDLPGDRLCDKLWAEQAAYFSGDQRRTPG